MHYYQHHIGDFMKDTGNLSNEQVGVYMKMLWLYYSSEKPFADAPDDIAFAVRSDEKTVQLLLRHYFTKDGDLWHHDRCDREIAQYHNKSDKARDSANARWRNANAMRTHDVSTENANACERMQTHQNDGEVAQKTGRKHAAAMRPHSERNANARFFDANQEPITNTKDIRQFSPCGDFATFWETYPKKVGKGQAEKVFAKIKPTPDLLAQMLEVIGWQEKSKQWQDGFIPNPATWLSQRRWEDEPPKTSVVYLTGNGVAL
jgi:uncharacterized protein YdaU (DUF1376 family)